MASFNGALGTRSDGVDPAVVVNAALCSQSLEIGQRVKEGTECTQHLISLCAPDHHQNPFLPRTG